ncbi:MAG: hypothetical protein ACOC5R_01485 [Elusimicrobiota bacterium]
MKYFKIKKIPLNVGAEDFIVSNFPDNIYGNLAIMRAGTSVHLIGGLGIYGYLTSGYLYIEDYTLSYKYSGLVYAGGGGINMELKNSSVSAEYVYPFTDYIMSEDETRQLFIDYYFGILYGRKF